MVQVIQTGQVVKSGPDGWIYEVGGFYELNTYRFLIKPYHKTRPVQMVQVIQTGQMVKSGPDGQT